jgi:hypothetical protein
MIRASMLGSNEAILVFVVVIGMIFVVPGALWIVARVRGRRSRGDR